jgi:hypothetical protein
MNRETSDRVLIAAPGTERPHRYRPKLRYELFGCGGRRGSCQWEQAR